jgi:hypothetical protein
VHGTMFTSLGSLVASAAGVMEKADQQPVKQLM